MTFVHHERFVHICLHLRNVSRRTATRTLRTATNREPIMRAIKHEGVIRAHQITQMRLPWCELKILKRWKATVNCIRQLCDEVIEKARLLTVDTKPSLEWQDFFGDLVIAGHKAGSTTCEAHSCRALALTLVNLLVVVVHLVVVVIHDDDNAIVTKLRPDSFSIRRFPDIR